MWPVYARRLYSHKYGNIESFETFSEMMLMGDCENIAHPNPNKLSDQVQHTFQTVSRSIVYLILFSAAYKK
jgi:hypothetical protein